MKTTEKLQGALSGTRLAHPNSNGLMRNSAGIRRRLRGVLLRLGVIFAVLLLMITTISGCAQERTQLYEQGITEGKSPDSVSAYAAPAHRDQDRVTFTTGRVVLVLGNYQSPITPEEMSRIREKVLDRAEIELGERPRPYGTAIPMLEAGEMVIAFGFAIDDDWVPSEYVGIGNEKAVELLHTRAKEWYGKKVAINPSINPLDGDRWVSIWSGTFRRYVFPYGGVVNNFTVYWNSRDWVCWDDNRDIFAVRQLFVMNPGIHVWPANSDFRNHMGFPQQDWSEGTIVDGLTEWVPLGLRRGAQTVTVCMGMGGGVDRIQWTYTQPNVVILDHSSKDRDIARWEMRFRTRAVQTTTGGMEPGSVAITCQPTSGTHRLIQVRALGEFRDPHWWGICGDHRCVCLAVNFYVTY